jgi:hypothetical protein
MTKLLREQLDKLLSTVMRAPDQVRGDPRIDLPAGWIAGSSPAMTTWRGQR